MKKITKQPKTLVMVLIMAIALALLVFDIVWIYTQVKKAYLTQGSGVELNNVELNSTEKVSNDKNDKQSFTLRGFFINKDVSACGYYSDGKNIFFEDNIIENADLETFDIVGLTNDSYLSCFKEEYTRDKNFVYSFGRKIEGADQNTFELLNRVYAKDKNFVYSFGRKIDGADSDTFKVLGDYYAKDKNSAYCDRKKMDPSVDINSFQSLDYNYAKDKNSVYKHGLKIDRDVDSFIIINSMYSKDNLGVYFEADFVPLEKIEGADPHTFEVVYQKNSNGYIINEYAKDKNNVYRDGQLIEGADPKTYKP